MREVTDLTFSEVPYNVYAEKTKIQPRWLKMGHATMKWQESLIKLRPSKQQNLKKYLLLLYAREGGRLTALYFYELSHKVVKYIWKWLRRPEKSKVSLLKILGLPARLIWTVIHTVRGQTNSICKHKNTISWNLRNTRQFRQPLTNSL